MGINFFWECGECQGTGVRHFNTQQGPQTETPCAKCGGTGRLVQQNRGLDDAFLLQMMAELSYLHGKVTAIWNAVKPGN